MDGLQLHQTDHQLELQVHSHNLHKQNNTCPEVFDSDYQSHLPSIDQHLTPVH